MFSSIPAKAPQTTEATTNTLHLSSPCCLTEKDCRVPRINIYVMVPTTNVYIWYMSGDGGSGHISDTGNRSMLIGMVQLPRLISTGPTL